MVTDLWAARSLPRIEYWGSFQSCGVQWSTSPLSMESNIRGKFLSSYVSLMLTYNRLDRTGRRGIARGADRDAGDNRLDVHTPNSIGESIPIHNDRQGNLLSLAAATPRQRPPIPVETPVNRATSTQSNLDVHTPNITGGSIPIHSGGQGNLLPHTTATPIQRPSSPVEIPVNQATSTQNNDQTELLPSGPSPTTISAPQAPVVQAMPTYIEHGSLHTHTNVKALANQIVLTGNDDPDQVQANLPRRNCKRARAPIDQDTASGIRSLLVEHPSSQAELRDHDTSSVFGSSSHTHHTRSDTDNNQANMHLFTISETPVDPAIFNSGVPHHQDISRFQPASNDTNALLSFTTSPVVHTNSGETDLHHRAAAEASVNRFDFTDNGDQANSPPHRNSGGIPVDQGTASNISDNQITVSEPPSSRAASSRYDISPVSINLSRSTISAGRISSNDSSLYYTPGLSPIPMLPGGSANCLC